jgi:hypothetical protein
MAQVPRPNMYTSCFWFSELPVRVDQHLKAAALGNWSAGKT